MFGPPQNFHPCYAYDCRWYNLKGVAFYSWYSLATNLNVTLNKKPKFLIAIAKYELLPQDLLAQRAAPGARATIAPSALVKR